MKKTVLVTGGGSGLGKGACLELVKRGHEVIATTENEEQAELLRQQAPQLIVEKLDITTNDIEKVSQWDIDVLANIAGMGQSGPIADIPIDRVRKILEVNVTGTIAITQKVLQKMIPKGAGRILIMSSIGGLVTVPSFGAYTMTKHALEAVGKTMREELAPQGIDVALINPGPYDTGFNDRMADSMWSWFNDDALQADNALMFKEIGAGITSNQLDPTEVEQLIADLVEAEQTEVQNLIPKNILESFGA